MISVLSFGFLYFCISKVNWQRNIVQRCARKECETDGLRSWQGSPSPPPSRSPGLCDTWLCAEPTQISTRSLFHICCKAMESLLYGFPCDAWGLPDAGIYIWSEKKKSFFCEEISLWFLRRQQFCRRRYRSTRSHSCRSLTLRSTEKKIWKIKSFLEPWGEPDKNVLWFVLDLPHQTTSHCSQLASARKEWSI